MAHTRKIIRHTVRAAILSSARFCTFKKISPWVKAPDASQLPAYAVATPREPVRRSSKSGTYRTTNVIVFVKRTGGEDLEDTLDVDSEYLETTVIAALKPIGLQDLELIEIDINSEGAERVGTLAMTFTVTWFAADSGPS